MKKKESQDLVNDGIALRRLLPREIILPLLTLNKIRKY